MKKKINFEIKVNKIVPTYTLTHLQGCMHLKFIIDFSIHVSLQPNNEYFL